MRRLRFGLEDERDILAAEGLVRRAASAGDWHGIAQADTNPPLEALILAAGLLERVDPLVVALLSERLSSSHGPYRWWLAAQCLANGRLHDQSLRRQLAWIPLAGVPAPWVLDALLDADVYGPLPEWFDRAPEPQQWRTRLTIVTALGRGSGLDRDCRALLRKALQDENSLVREAAAAAIGRNEDTTVETTQALLRTCGDPSLKVQWAARKALDAIVALSPDRQELVERRERELQQESEMFEHQWGNRGRVFWAKWKESSAPGAEEPGVVGGYRGPVHRLTHEQEADALMKLGDHGSLHAGALERVIAALSTPTWRIRLAAVTTLGRAGGSSLETLSALRGTFQEDSNLEVRRAAAYALADVSAGEAATIAVLRQAILAEDEPVAWLAAEALGSIARRVPEARDVLTDLLDGPSTPANRALPIHALAIADGRRRPTRIGHAAAREAKAS